MKIDVKSLPKEKIVSTLVPFLNVLIALGLVFLVVVPKVKQIPKLKEEKKTLEVRLDKLSEKSKKLEALFAAKTALESNLELLEQAIPSKEKVPELMTQTQEIATASGVRLTGLQYGGRGETAKKGAPKEVAAKIALKAMVAGSFEALNTFIKNLEEASRVINVEDLKFTKGREKEEGELSSTLGLVSFFVPPPQVFEVDAPLTLDLGAPATVALLDQVKALKIYKVEVDTTGVGREDPFAR